MTRFQHLIKNEILTFLVAQGTGIQLPMQVTQVRSLVQKYYMYLGAAKPCATTPEACTPGARAPKRSLHDPVKSRSLLPLATTKECLH